MSTMVTRLLDQVMALPRAMRWAVLALAFIALFLVWDATLGAVAADWSARADRVEAELAKVRGGRDLVKRLDDATLQRTMTNIGPVSVPGEDTKERDSLGAMLLDVLDDHSVKDESFELKGGYSALPGNVSERILPGKKIGRITGEVRFTAPQDDAIAIIGEYERHPDIESISAVRIVKDDDDLKVVLTLEAWVQVKGKRS